MQRVEGRVIATNSANDRGNIVIKDDTDILHIHFDKASKHFRPLKEMINRVIALNLVSVYERDNQKHAKTQRSVAGLELYPSDCTKFTRSLPCSCFTSIGDLFEMVREMDASVSQTVSVVAVLTNISSNVAVNATDQYIQAGVLNDDTGSVSVVRLADTDDHLTNLSTITQYSVVCLHNIQLVDVVSCGPLPQLLITYDTLVEVCPDSAKFSSLYEYASLLQCAALNDDENLSPAEDLSNNFLHDKDQFGIWIDKQDQLSSQACITRMNSFNDHAKHPNEKCSYLLDIENSAKKLSPFETRSFKIKVIITRIQLLDCLKSYCLCCQKTYAVQSQFKYTCDNCVDKSKSAKTNPRRYLRIRMTVADKSGSVTDPYVSAQTSLLLLGIDNAMQYMQLSRSDLVNLEEVLTFKHAKMNVKLYWDDHIKQHALQINTIDLMEQ
ncbi:hypothetical protein MIR68_001694 [Amoeboaphelidium protococcarum]|nr:hypothetical protein MIR68_001694 [Amoeboaphelidium protococcarum]